MNRRQTNRVRFTYEQSLTSFTSMVDVVFLLLVYFVLSFHVPDVMAHLGVNCPGEGPPGPVIQLLTVTVLQDGYALNKAHMDYETLSEHMHKLADLDTNQHVTVLCSQRSKHEDLVAVLDLCAKEKLANISVVSGRE